MRKTKIICTIGPASEDKETLRAMCLAGMNVARLNFSHGSYESHAKVIENIKEVREELGLPIAILLDTKGPEVRVKSFKDDGAQLDNGSLFMLTTRDIEGDASGVSQTYPGLPHELKPGDSVFADDGHIVMTVEKTEGEDVYCRVVTGGYLRKNKGLNFPGTRLHLDFLSEKDKADLLFGIREDVDLVAASFVSDKADMESIRSFLDENGGKDINIIAKIENKLGLENLEEIMDIADAVMVARGDLGVEIPYAEVPFHQKQIIRHCNKRGKEVIIATEMLESMTTDTRATRAEVSDVANGVYDSASALMLSGETANGSYPVEAVRVMADIAEYTEGVVRYKKNFQRAEFEAMNVMDSLSRAACQIALDLDAKALGISSISGITARMVSRFRCPVDIIGITSDTKAYYKLALTWGVTPYLAGKRSTLETILDNGAVVAKRVLNLSPGDTVVLTGGRKAGVPGSTDTIRVETII